MSIFQRRSRCLSCLISLLVLLTNPFAFDASEPQTEKTTQPKKASSESYEVYSALLTQHYREWFRKKAVVKIAAYTTVPSHGPGGHLIEQCASEADNDTDRDLIKQLSADQIPRQMLEAKLDVPGRYMIVTGKPQIDENIEPGIVWLSPVAFSKDRRHAMVWVRNFCGGLCGSGMMWKVNLTDHGWRVAGNVKKCGFIS